MFWCRINCSLTICMVFVALIQWQQRPVRAAPSCDGDCLEEKLNEILSKLKTLHGKVETLTSQPEIEPSAVCIHQPNAHRKQHTADNFQEVESNHHRRSHSQNSHSAASSTDTANNYNNKCPAHLAQLCQTPGLSEIQLAAGKVISALCDVDRWMVVLQRLDGSVAFHNRTWDAYKLGFGVIGEKSEFFVGLQHLHELSSSGFFELRIDMTDFRGVAKYAHYSDFSVFNERAAYKLGILGVYHGTAGDAFIYHEGQPFSTVGRDNDAKAQGSCSEEYNSPGWFKSCMEANIFGNYLHGETDKFKEGMYWETFHGPEYSLKSVKLAIRAKC